jgi:hypothetical protein
MVLHKAIPFVSVAKEGIIASHAAPGGKNIGAFFFQAHSAPFLQGPVSLSGLFLVVP